MNNNSWHYAKYTLILQDYIFNYPERWNELKAKCTLESENQTTKFWDMFESMYNMWEIGGETLEEFETFILNNFNMQKDYYQQLLNAYETEINFMDGVASTIEEMEKHTDTSSGNSNQENIDLPNKVTAKEYISNKSKNTYAENRGLDITRNVSNKGGVNVVTQKKDFMNLLRSVYHDFAKEFIRCFISLWG